MIGGIREAPGIGVKQSLSSGAGRSPPPTGATEQGGLRRGAPGVWPPPAKFRNGIWNGGVWSPRPTGATQVVPSNGPMYLGHGFRRPNFVPKFGASVMGIGPYAPRGDEGRHAGSSCPTGGCGEPAIALGSGAQRSVCGADGRNGRGSEQGSPQRDHQRRTIPQSACG